MPDARIEVARDMVRRGYELQKQGELDLAADLYRQSIQLHPTAEAYTCLGWTYRNRGRLEEAIQECKKAIDLDPSYGNPYNDIGAYLLELGRPDEAIPWLEKAVKCERYEACHYAWYNLGRVYLAKEMFNEACRSFKRSLEINPGYKHAAEALRKVRLLLQ